MSDNLLITFGAEEHEDRKICDVLEFFRAFRVLAVTWSVAGNFEVQFRGEPVTFFHYSDGLEYVQEMEDRVLEMRGSFTDSSVLSWLVTVEESFRTRAVEMCRAPEEPMPWGMALISAQQQLYAKWDQHKDHLVSASTPRTKDLPTRREKGTGRGVKREHDEGDDEDKRHPKSRGKGRREDMKPKQEGGTEFRKIRTGSTWNGKPLCKRWNDERRCTGRKCPFGHEHRCDVLLQQGSVCASSSHTRLEHNSNRHGAASYL